MADETDPKRGDPTDVLAPPPRAEQETSPPRMELRVISNQGARHALKLEQIFWRVLELAAASKKQRLGAYIGEQFAQHSAETNHTSALRVHAVEWLSKRLIDATSRSLSPKMLGILVQSIPVPCFCVDNSNTFICHNEKLLKFLTPVAEQSDGNLTTVRVTFQRGVGQIREAVMAAGNLQVDDVVIFKSGEKVLEKAVRIAGIVTPHGRLTGLFVVFASD